MTIDYQVFIDKFFWGMNQGINLAWQVMNSVPNLGFILIPIGLVVAVMNFLVRRSGSWRSLADDILDVFRRYGFYSR